MKADLFFSFRSPYSYLAIGRYRRLAEEWGCDIALRPVYPLAIRDPAFFANMREGAMAYTLMDVRRCADYLGLPFAWPDPDPVVQDLSTRAISDEQPYIRRLTRLGQIAANEGCGIGFAAEVAALVWGGTRNWHEGDHLRRIADGFHLNFDRMELLAREDAHALDMQIGQNLQELADAGHWGVPTLVFDGEPFFGHDRIDHVMWRLQQAGLQRR